MPAPTGDRMAEQQVLQQIAEALRPSVLRGVAIEQWPPAFVNILVHHIIAQSNGVQFELKQVCTECARLKQTEADLRADPIRIWLREAQAAEQAAQRRADQANAEMTRLTQRLEAEQRAREVEVSERDRKIANLNQLPRATTSSRCQTPMPLTDPLTVRQSAHKSRA